MKFFFLLFCFLLCQLAVFAQTPDWKALHNQMLTAYNAGNYAQAVTFAQKTLTQAEKEFGKKDTTYITALNDLGVMYSSNGEYAKAEPVLRQALALKEKNTASYAATLVNLAYIYNDTGEYVKAEPILKEALATYEKTIGKENSLYAIALNSLAYLYDWLGNYQKAEPLYREVIRLREKVSGKDTQAYATALNNLATLYGSMGDAARSEPLLREALDRMGKAVGKEHPEYATTLTNLGFFYDLQGSYTRAEPLYAEALRISEKTLGKQHPQYANALNNLAVLYQSLGNYPKAEALQQEAIAVREKVLGKKNPDYATSLQNLASVYMSEKRYSKAEPLFIQAVAIFKEALGNENQQYANALNNLALLYDYQYNFAKAEPLYQQVLGIREKVFGKGNPNYALSLNNLATLNANKKDFAKAEPLYTQALDTFRKTLGTAHPYYTTTLSSLGAVYENMGQPEKAETLLAEANANDLQQLDDFFPTLSETEKEAFYQTLSTRFEYFNTFTLHNKARNPQLTASLYDLRLATKALLINSSLKIKNHILKSKNTELIGLYHDWQAKKVFLSRAYQMSNSRREKMGIDIPKLEEEANALEKQLSARSEIFATVSDKKRYSWKDVQQKLKPNEAALELVRFRLYDKKWTDTVYYAALLITPDAKLPEMVLLPNGNDLENRYLSLYHNAIRSKTKDATSYNAFWKPIADRLNALPGKVKKVYVSPDGVYNSLNLNTLQNPQSGNYLLDELTIKLLTNTKELAQPRKTGKAGKKAFLFGYPDYGSPEPRTDTTRSLDFNDPEPNSDTLRRFFMNGTIPMLPGTEKEVNQIEKVYAKKHLQSQKFTLIQASESQVKALESPLVLHLSTHGFFMPVLPPSNNALPGNHKAPDNPLLRSGLLLSGSQLTFAGKNTPDAEDGILTAYEATGLDLEGTELVVLSACETGLGDIKNGEGVYGLQRAFTVAGAKTILMSLWKVNDDATQELMTLFYENWLKSGDKRTAFAIAQRTLRKKYPQPYFWGAFVLVGE